MKLILLQPPIQDFYETPIRLQPIGLCFLKAAVTSSLPGIEVVVKDYHHGWGRRTIPLPKELAYLEDFYSSPDQSPFSSFYQYYHFGASFEAIGEDLAREGPDLIGISSLFSPYYGEVLQCAAEIKKRVGVPILVGGSHVSAAPWLTLTDPHIDFVIRGEGERALVEFLKTWLNGRRWDSVPNLGFKRNGQLILNRIGQNYPIEELPFPDLSDFPIEKYLFDKRPLSVLLTSRGCPHGCRFCSTYLTFGKAYRPRAPEHVLQEIRARYQQGYRVFDFEDDNLTFDRERMKRLCGHLIDNFSPGEVQLLAMNGIPFFSLDGELMGLMKRAGFTHLNLSLVSADRAVCHRTERSYSLIKYVAVVHEAVRLGFKTVSYQILGLPYERLETMLQTLSLAARLPVLLGASPFYLTPGSPLSKDFREPTKVDIVRSRLTAMASDTPHFSREDIYTLFLASRVINFLKGIEFHDKQVGLPEALRMAERRGRRSALGAELFERLLTERRLYAATKNGLRQIRPFRSDLFFDLWSRLDRIGTQTGGTITLR